MPRLFLPFAIAVGTFVSAATPAEAQDRRTKVLNDRAERAAHDRGEKTADPSKPGVMVRAGGHRAGLVPADAAAYHDTRARSDATEHVVEDRAADIVENDVDATRRDRLQALPN